MDWIEKVGKDLKYVCNGDITKDEAGNFHCKMDNGEIIASVSPGDKVRMLTAYRRDERTPTRTQHVRMESYSDEMVVTRSLSGSIEFLHRMGESPEVRIEQDGKKLKGISVVASNPKVNTSVYGWF